MKTIVTYLVIELDLMSFLYNSDSRTTGSETVATRGTSAHGLSAADCEGGWCFARNGIRWPEQQMATRAANPELDRWQTARKLSVQNSLAGTG